MFGYASDRAEFVAAALLATRAAMVLYDFPMAKQIALGIGVLVSNPGSIRDAAGQWQAPSTGDGEIDFDGIRQQVVALKGRIEEGDLWKGPAEETFSGALDGLLEQLDAAKQHMQGVGDSMESVATLYHVAAETCMITASVMFALATAWVVVKCLPWQARAIGYVLVVETLVGLGQVVRKLGVKMGKTVMVTAGTVAMVNLMCASMSQMLTKNRPKPDFAPTGVEYTPPEKKDGVGGLKPTNDGMPTMPDMGGGGMMGLI